MSQLSLRKKMLLAAALPFLAFLVLAGLSIGDNARKMRLSASAAQNLRVVSALSGVIHELQKERGKSATFLNGGLALEEVTAQRRLTDQKLAVLQPLAGTDAVSSLPDLRAKVTEKKVATAEAIPAFTSLITALLEEERAAAESAEAADPSGRFRTIPILEAAKENAGRMRAHVSSLLVADKPLTETQFTTLVQTKAGVDVNLASPALAVLPGSTISQIKAILSGTHWVSASETFQIVLKKADSGGFGRDAKAFFTTITAAMDEMATLLDQVLGELRDTVEKRQRSATQGLATMSLVTLVLLASLIFLVGWIIRAIALPVSAAVEQLTDSSVRLAEASRELDATGEQISSAATEAAASVQETVASVEEITSMIQRNAENSTKVQEQTETGRQRVLEGRRVVQEMVRAIEEISTTNEQAFQQIAGGNRKISEIVGVIAQIGEKTKVINDIVFQTRLLSFNASVEAARAGESGKGFAVVAEEVGKLAQMSGQAAQEITAMLEKGIQQVGQIVQETTSSAEQAFVTGKSRVEAGGAVARQCDSVLEQIVADVSGISQSVTEISTASREQALGVQEITKAMNQMDQVTQQNAASANESAAATKNLAAQADRLQEIIASLGRIVSGKA